MKNKNRITSLIAKFKSEIIITILFILIGYAIEKFLDFIFLSSSEHRIIITLLILSILFMFLQMFIIRGNVIFRIDLLQSRIDQISGRLTPSQYDERKRHFSEEKHRIIENLISLMLPPHLDRALKGDISQQQPSVAVIVDSGTTLEQFFPRAKLLGFGANISEAELRRIQIYTNSLSGSDAFCKMHGSYLHEDQLHLFGGTQIEKYRAVLGEVTMEALNTVEIEYHKKGEQVIGIITANWILVGAAHDKLIFCSTEQGHLDFKKRLAELADTLIIVAPLGKLLKLNTTIELNTILKLTEEQKPEYKGFEIEKMEKRNKGNTFLLTTYRNDRRSLLYNHSENLILRHNDKMNTIYTLLPKSRDFILDFNYSNVDQLDIEMPHEYLREHAFKVYGAHIR